MLEHQSGSPRIDLDIAGASAEASAEVRRHGALPEAVVVTHNSMKDLEGFIECTPLRASFSRIIVVDNASVDGSPDAARAAGLEVIELTENGGFGAAANVGMRLASSEFVCVLNPDIRLPGDDVLPKLLRHFSDPAAAVMRLAALRLHSEPPFTTAINVEEIHRGLRPAERLAANRLFDGLRMASIGRAEGIRAGDWRREHAVRGVTLAQADCLLAATAFELGVPLATGNPKDFPMPEVQIEHWPVGV
jgi:predicted nucleic acid-binding protein